MQAIQHDDELAFAELYKRHWKQAHELAYSKVKSKEVTEDIIQELFIALWDKRKTLSIQNITSYIYVSVKNRVLNYIASSLVHKKCWNYYKNFVPQSEETTQKIVQYDHLREAIEHGLNSLPNKSKTVFRLNHEQGLSIPEIAGHLNLSEKAIQYHITRSLKHLRVFLKNYMISFFPLMYFYIANS